MIDSLSILHITDFHINDELPVGYEFKLSHVAEAAIREVTGEKLFVVVSGDIAATGAAKEYDRATHVFDCLFKSIKARFKGDVNLILVPGNHDIYDPPEVVPKYRDDAEREKQLNKMDDFFCFSLECEIDWSNRDVLVSKYPLSPDTGFSDVRFCCLNTVPFSTLEYDKGAHTLTHESLSALCKEDPSELSVVVAHHGPEWLDDTSRLEFETEAARSIDLMVVGHEHRGGTIQQQYSSKSSLPILRGGTFSLDDEGGECTFTVINIGVLQHGEYMADETRFEWDSSSRVFIIRNKNNNLLSLKCLVPRPNGEFVKKLTEEINKDPSFFSDSFSFPRLKSNVSFLPKDDNLISRQSVSILSENDFLSFA